MLVVIFGVSLAQKGWFTKCTTVAPEKKLLHLFSQNSKQKYQEEALRLQQTMVERGGEPAGYLWQGEVRP